MFFGMPSTHVSREPGFEFIVDTLGAWSIQTYYIQEYLYVFRLPYIYEQKSSITTIGRILTINWDDEI